MTTAYKPDAIVNLETERGLLTVYLAEGGEQFPWASHKGQVIIGPPDGTCTSDGTPMDRLEWNIDPYWVVEAMDTEGNAVELDPNQYAQAVQEAIAQGPRYHFTGALDV